MTAFARKALSDAWQERTRSVFLIASLAAGIAALVAFLGSSSILTREVSRGFLATDPASFVLHTDSVDEELLTKIREDPEVGNAEARRILYGRIKTGPAQWHLLALFVIPNYSDIRLNKFSPEGGAWPPATGDVLIERDAFKVARTSIGSTITFRTDDRRSHTLQLAEGFMM